MHNKDYKYDHPQSYFQNTSKHLLARLHPELRCNLFPSYLIHLSNNMVFENSQCHNFLTLSVVNNTI